MKKAMEGNNQETIGGLESAIIAMFPLGKQSFSMKELLAHFGQRGNGELSPMELRAGLRRLLAFGIIKCERGLYALDQTSAYFDSSISDDEASQILKHKYAVNSDFGRMKISAV